MSDAIDREDLRFRALADAAMAAVEGKPIGEVAARGLAAAVAHIGLSAGALLVWDSKGEVVAQTVTADSPEHEAMLLDAESTRLSKLRKEFNIVSIYMEEGGETGISIFSLPIEIGSRQFGALVGVKTGRARLQEYDTFIRSLAAVLALALAPSKAIDDLAVGVNHQINNLLTPLLGMVDLLMKDAERLPDEVKRKLEVIRESANKITKVAARLKIASKQPRVPYVDGEWMIQLSGEDVEGQDPAAGGGEPES